MSSAFRTIVGVLVILSGGAILNDGGLTLKGLSPNADPLVLAFGLFLVVAGAFWVWDRDSPPEPH